MNNVMQTRIASVLTAMVGIGLLFSPIFVTITGGALVSTLIVSAILVLAGIVEYFWENTIPSWVSGVTALWMIVSIVVFSMSGAELWTTGIAAAASFILAMWDGIEVEQVQHHHVHA